MLARSDRMTSLQLRPQRVKQILYYGFMKNWGISETLQFDWLISHLLGTLCSQKYYLQNMIDMQGENAAVT